MRGMHLWALERNVAAQRFYHAQGGSCVTKALAPAPSGVSARLIGTPAKLRIAWTDASAALRQR